MISEAAAEQVVVIDYTNWRGERSARQIIPEAHTFRFEDTPYHPGPQWVFDAFDCGKAEVRTFAMKGVHSWSPAEP
jgi:predicted DNA-binding transcriptional regulator YafY